MHVLNFFSDDEDYQAAIFAADEWRAAEIWKAIEGRFWPTWPTPNHPARSPVA